MRHVCCYTVGSNLANIFFTLEISHCLLHGSFHLFRTMPDSARLISTLFELYASRRPSIAPVVVYVSKYIHINGRIILTHCGRVTQICVFNTVKLGTSASSP